MFSKKYIDKSIFFKKNYFIPLIVLSSYYLFSIIFFGDLVFRIHDNLEVGPVYKKVIQDIYTKSLESYKILLSGEYRWYFLEELLYPVNFFYFILKLKNFIILEEFLKKIFSYWSFYILSKKITNKKIHSSLVAILYCSLVNSYSYNVGYALVFLPYLFYFLNFKKRISFKNYLIIFLIGLNSSIVHDYLVVLSLIPLTIFLNYNNSLKLKNFINFFILFTIACVISNLQIFISVFVEDLHRQDFLKPSFFDNFFSQINIVLNFFINQKNSSIFFLFKGIIYSSIFFISILLKNSKTYKVILFIFIIFFFNIFFGSNLIEFIFNDHFTFLKGYNFTRIVRVFPFLFCLLLLFNFKLINNTKVKKIYILFFFTCSFFLQSMIPIKEYLNLILKNQIAQTTYLKAKALLASKQYLNVAKLIIEEIKHDNLHISFFMESEKSFDNYYRVNDYREIKKIVENNAVISIGINPMIAAMNEIKIVDGYYNMYPKTYKIKFRKIIEEELDKDPKVKDYFDNWGSRLNIFFKDPKSLSLNYQAAKKLGAYYIISTFKLHNKYLSEECISCFKTRNLYLYKIL